MIRDAFLEAAGRAVDLIGGREVRDAWELDSVLAGFQVGGLAGHLARAILLVERYLEDDLPDRRSITAAQAFAGLEDTNDAGAEWNVGVRRRGEETASGGPDELARRTVVVLERLRDRLSVEPSERHVATSRGVVLLLDEYLRTRLVELTVHMDDLASSVGLSVPELPREAYRIAVETLVDAAVVKHGYPAVLRALARRERDTVQALRVL